MLPLPCPAAGRHRCHAVRAGHNSAVATGDTGCRLGGRLRPTPAPPLPRAHLTIEHPAMTTMRVQLAVLAVVAASLIAVEGHAQYGTPIPLRLIAPTIKDTDPGVAPTPESEARINPVYRRQVVLYRTNEAPGTI